MYGSRQGVGAYQTVRRSVDESDPHKIVALLLAGAVERVVQGASAIQRGDRAAKLEAINKAIGIVDGLRASLDLGAGGEIAANLDSLYDYMGQRLILANATEDTGPLVEVQGLLEEIQGAWAELPRLLAPAGPAPGQGADHVA